MTKLSEVVRGVEEKETLDPMRQSQKAVGHNKLASADVVVDREKINELLWNEDKQPYIGLVEQIATAIESGSIISLKGENNG